MKNSCAIDISKLTSLAAMRGDSEEDTVLLKEMAVEASSFLTYQQWCNSVTEQFFGYGVGGVVAIFLCMVDSASEDVDACLWVVVGDLPPAYIVTEDNPDVASALGAYVEEMSTWVDAVKEGESVEELIPVNVPPTLESARRLQGRLEFLRVNIIPSLR